MSDGDDLEVPRPGPWQRLLHGSENASIGDRLRAAMLKPVDPAAQPKAELEPKTVEELRAAERYADDKERFFGLIAAPLAAAVGFLIVNYQIDHDPKHANVTTYHTLELVLLALALVMLATAWYRRRLFLGIAMALYGLGVFNLHYWGFGVPFLLGGAWLLVRAYRAHQGVRDATGEGRRGRGAASGISRPRANKRYTPPI